MEQDEIRTGKTFYYPYAVPVITLDVLLSIAAYLYPSLHNFFVWHMILCEPIEACKFGLWLACICATLISLLRFRYLKTKTSLPQSINC